MDVALGCFSDDDYEFDMTKPPSSGIEYLKRVQLEALQCPDVVNVKRPTNIEAEIMDKTEVQTSRDKKVNPGVRNQLKVASDFACLRQTLNQYRIKNQHVFEVPVQKETLWCLFCFGSKFYQDCYKRQATKAEIELLDTDEGHAPLLSIISIMKPSLAVIVFEYHLKWFKLKGFSMVQGHWFFGLLLCIDKPTPPDIVSLLREFARHCLTYRTVLTASESPDMELINQLNIFPVIVSKHFGQDDLET